MDQIKIAKASFRQEAVTLARAMCVAVGWRKAVEREFDIYSGFKPIQDTPCQESRTTTAPRTGALKSKEDEKKPPLFDRPLRLPGQSIDERLDNFQQNMVEKALLALFTVVLARVEWSRWLFPVGARPLVYTGIGGLCVIYSWRHVKPLWQQAKALKQGRDRERHVGEILAELQRKGYRSFLHFFWTALALALISTTSLLGGPED